MLIADLLAWHQQHPGDWRKAWQLLEDKWDTNDPCPNGALTPYNIDAKLNGAYIALGLLYGELDMGKTIEISTRAGQDSDCNPSSAAGILGVMLGYERIPDVWKGGIPAIADEKFRFTDFSFRTIVESTEKRALALIRQTGGQAEGETVRVKPQKPKAARLEVWNYGKVAERVNADDARWKFTGAWKKDEKRPTRTASAQGAEAAIAFTGTGVIVVGPYLPAGGKADVYLDGKLNRTVDVNSDEKGPKGGESVWYAFGLKNGPHTVRVVVRGEPFGDRAGTEVAVEEAVVFR